jgi:UDP-N-acetylglucosamine--N-acetylmuramyl-(pentapeptide) pyrophosphoryl-undecaprenol N-acetylglucosamine transferase
MIGRLEAMAWAKTMPKSTGSAVALPFFALARVKGLCCHYIESAARCDRPSMTGSLIGRIPGVHLYTQSPVWASEKWSFRGSVFDAFEQTASATGEKSARLGKIVVSLGTYRGYGFPRLVRRLIEILPPEADVLWQTGDTDVSGLGISGHYAIPERGLAVSIEADQLSCGYLLAAASSRVVTLAQPPTFITGADSAGYEEEVEEPPTARSSSNR